MKTNLIVSVSLDEQRARKESLVRRLDDAGHLVKHGDDSVESDEEVYFFRVISISDYRTKLLQEIGRGYDGVDLSSVFQELDVFVNTLNRDFTPPQPSEELQNNKPSKEVTPTPVPETPESEEEEEEEESEEEEEIDEDNL